MQLAEARIDHEWTLTASLMALIANIHRDRKKHPRPFEATDIYKPRRVDRHRQAPPIKADISALKDVFIR